MDQNGAPANGESTISTKGGLDTAGPQFYRKCENLAPTNGGNTIWVVLDLQN